MDTTIGLATTNDFTHLELVPWDVGQKHPVNVILLMPLAAPFESVINKE